MIDLCSTTSESSGEDEITIFSPVNLETKLPVKSDSADVIKQIYLLSMTMTTTIQL